MTRNWNPTARAATRNSLSFKKENSQFFASDDQIHGIWMGGAMGTGHGFCTIRHNVGFHNKHRNGHGQQHASIRDEVSVQLHYLKSGVLIGITWHPYLNGSL
jgi:hypothetical protein